MGTKWDFFAIAALREAALDPTKENVQKAADAIVVVGNQGSAYSFLVEVDKRSQLSFFGKMKGVLDTYPVCAELDYALRKEVQLLSGALPVSPEKQFVQLAFLHKLLQKADFVPQDIRTKYMDRIESILEPVPNLGLRAIRSRKTNDEFAAIRKMAKRALV